MRLFDLVALGTVPVLSGVAGASVLTFELESGSFGSEQVLPQNYGDRIVSMVQDGYVYGTDFGFTPNVEVDWHTGSGSVGGNAAYWSTGFGDLVGVIEAEPEPNGCQFTLVADSGYNVTLHGFDMAAWNRDEVINSVRVLDGDDNVLFEDLEAMIPEAGHRSFDFGAPLVAEVIKIEWDSSDLGGGSDNIAMDNIAFGQELVPSPAGVGVLLMGGVVATRRRR